MEEDIAKEDIVRGTGCLPLSKRNDKVNFTTVSLRIERTLRDKIAIEARSHGMSMYSWIISTLERELGDNKDRIEKEDNLMKLMNQKLDTITNLISKL